VNTTLAKTEELLSQLENVNIQAEGIQELSGSFFVNADRKTITDLSPYKDGLLYIQSLASQIPVKALDVQPGEKVLDLCAAPGSKTTQLAIAMNCQGELIANEPNRERFFKLLSNLKHQKVDHFVTPKKYPGQNYPAFYAEYFDRVLVDAPCSSESRFIEDDPKSYHYWSAPKVKSLAKLQKKLLTAAIHCVKPGGTIVYSTCSFSPEENELVLHDLLKRYPQMEVEEIECAMPSLPILKEWNGRELNPSIGKAFRIHPDQKVESFFIAKLKKVKTLPLKAQANTLANGEI
jgi:16S rRNA (cytosine1407-C5)-methyltransferase